MSNDSDRIIESDVEAIDDAKEASPKSTQSALVDFLSAIEKKATDPNHKRLIKAARAENPGSSIEGELRNIITEILNED